jgi:hypothetical protein
MRRIIALAFAALLGVPVAAAAQRGGGAPPFYGPRGAYSFELSDGEPVSFYLEWSRVLQLSEEQREGLIEVRRKLRVQNAPFMQQLDSLRERAGVNMSERGRLTEEDREALKRFNDWAAPVIDSIRLNNDGARREIRALLDARQMAKADSVQQAMRDPRTRRPAR